MAMVIRYQCEVCDAIYDTKEHAKACEKYHVGADKILRENRDRTDKLLNRPYPKSIDVLMTDGKILRYQKPEEVTE